MNTSSRQARALRLLLAQVASADGAIACCNADDAFFCRILGSPAEDIASMRWLHEPQGCFPPAGGISPFPSAGPPSRPPPPPLDCPPRQIGDAMPPPLPRVTYSNVADDFSAVHAHLDALLLAVRANLLGRTRPNLIAGREDEDGVRYTAPSPINRDWPLGSFFAASSGAVDRAVAAAGAAYPDWSRRPWAERVAALRCAADRIECQKYEIACACLFEVGKSRMEAVGEVEE